MTGGSGHKAQKNSEGSKARNNRMFIDELLDDYANNEKTDGVYVGRVLRRMGCGRMEVFYLNEKRHDVQQIIPMRGGLRGKGKKSVWVDVDSLVMIAETGLSGATHEIVAVFTDQQVVRYKDMMKDADPRLFLKGGSERMDGEDAVEFDRTDDNADVDVDAI